MKILAIDPGTTKSAWVYFETSNFKIIEFGYDDNLRIRDSLKPFDGNFDADALVIEMIKSYGNVMGDSVIETCVWIGRFIEAWSFSYYPIPRKTIVTELCQTPRANDSNVRQAIIDLYAEHLGVDDRKAVIGKKSSPGALYGITGDIWSALAVAICFKFQNERVKGNGKIS